MYNLTISQEFFLCALDERGKFSAWDSTGPICLLAGSLLDLVCAQCVNITEKEKVEVTAPLPAEFRHVAPLYDYLQSKKPMKLADLTLEYTFTFSDKRMNELAAAIGASLVEAGCATAEEGGFFSSKTAYVPTAGAVDYVVQKMRAELLETGPVSQNTVALVSLLNKSGDIKKYFSEYEKAELAARLKKFKQSPENATTQKMLETFDMVFIIMLAIMGS